MSTVGRFVIWFVISVPFHPAFGAEIDASMRKRRIFGSLICLVAM